MDGKIDSIDNDGNITSTSLDEFDSMNTSVSMEENLEKNNYETTYNSEFNMKNEIDDEFQNDKQEEYDVFGNSKQPKKEFNKKILLIPIILLIIIILVIFIFIKSSNKFTIENKNIIIKVKETEEIEVKAKEKVKKKLTYSSGDTKIATVDDDGTIKGVSIGNTTIYVGINGKKTSKINVKVETNKEELVLKESNIKIKKDENYQLEVKNVLEDDVFEWISNNENIVTVDQQGILTGIHGGTTTVVVKEKDGRKVSTKVTVISDEVLIDKISLESKTIAIGEKIALVPVIEPANSLSILSWKSSKESVVEIDEKGVITGLSEGTSTITVQSHNGKKATAKITVDKKIPASISMSGCNGSVTIGSPITLTTNLKPDTASSKITWISSNSDIATVSGGKVSGKAVGKVTITAKTANGKTATCNLSVTPTAISSIKASITNVTLDQQETKKVSITISPSSASKYYKVSFKSSNTNIAKVSSDGTITGVNPGSATITATVGGKSVKINVNVNASNVTSIKMTGCQSSMEAGKRITLTAQALPTTAKDTGISWSSSDTAIATVSRGNVTAKKAGVVTITAKTANGTTATCKINVTKPAITKLSLSEKSITLSVGSSKSITATTNLTTTEFNKFYIMSWKSSNTLAVTVTPNSTNSLKVTIKGVKKGSSTVHATVGGKSITLQVVVE